VKERTSRGACAGKDAHTCTFAEAAYVNMATHMCTRAGVYLDPLAPSSHTHTPADAICRTGCAQQPEGAGAAGVRQFSGHGAHGEWGTTGPGNPPLSHSSDSPLPLHTISPLAPIEKRWRASWSRCVPRPPHMTFVVAACETSTLHPLDATCLSSRHRHVIRSPLTMYAFPLLPFLTLPTLIVGYQATSAGQSVVHKKAHGTLQVSPLIVSINRRVRPSTCTSTSTRDVCHLPTPTTALRPGRKTPTTFKTSCLCSTLQRWLCCIRDWRRRQWRLHQLPVSRGGAYYQPCLNMGSRSFPHIM
jgi:hypothetical protein